MKKCSRGFTLVEIAIVIGVVGLLASIVLVAYNNVQQQARDTKRQNDVRIMLSQLKKYYDQNGEFPDASSQFMIDLSKSGLNDPTDILTWNYSRNTTTSYCSGTTPRWGGGSGSLGPSCRNYVYISGSNGTGVGDDGRYGPGCNLRGSGSNPYFYIGWYDESSKTVRYTGVNTAISTNATSTAFPGQVCEITQL